MKLRLPEALKNNILRAAEESGRSMNAEIVARLEQSFGEEKDLATRVNVLEQQVRSLLGFPREEGPTKRANPFTGDTE